MFRVFSFVVLALSVSACGESRRHNGKGKGQNADALGKSQHGSDAETFDEGEDKGPRIDSTYDTAKDDEVAPGDSAAPDEVPPTREPCSLGAEKFELATIDDVVRILNKLPLPVTLPCLLDVLPRPLRIVATSSGLSIQPALDAENPRVFALSGQLVLAIVPNGPNATLLELSQILSATRSVKGEIVFPVTEVLDTEDPYAHTEKLDGSEGTRCQFCHGSETVGAGGRYESRALRPVQASVVPYTQLLDLKEECAGVDTGRCEILKALFGSEAGDAVEGKFPEEMPTMF